MRELSEAEAKSLRPASDHYTAYVGPPTQYDIMGATQFNLLCSLGLRETHRVLDFGCGSLRAGRLLIQYLQPGGYFGIEPNAWLVDEAFDRQLGADIRALKRPTFSDASDFDADKFGVKFDFIVAQSIFSHSGPQLTATALKSFAATLAPSGLCAVTFIPGDEDTPEGWYYTGLTKRGTVRYRPALIEQLLADAGLKGQPIPWFHPRQQWWILGFELPPADHLAQLKGVVLRCEDFAGSTASATP